MVSTVGSGPLEWCAMSRLFCIYADADGLTEGRRRRGTPTIEEVGSWVDRGRVAGPWARSVCVIDRIQINICRQLFRSQPISMQPSTAPRILENGSLIERHKFFLITRTRLVILDGSSMQSDQTDAVRHYNFSMLPLLLLLLLLLPLLPLLLLLLLPLLLPLLLLLLLLLLLPPAAASDRHDPCSCSTGLLILAPLCCFCPLLLLMLPLLLPLLPLLLPLSLLLQPPAAAPTILLLLPPPSVPVDVAADCDRIKPRSCPHHRSFVVPCPPSSVQPLFSIDTCKWRPGCSLRCCCCCCCCVLYCLDCCTVHELDVVGHLANIRALK